MIGEIVFSAIAFLIIWFIIFRVIIIYERKKMLKDIVKKMEAQLKRDLTKQFDLTPLEDSSSPLEQDKKETFVSLEQDKNIDAKKEMKKKLNKKLKEKLKK